MHSHAYTVVKQFVNKYLEPNSSHTVLDVGAYNVNGSYRPLFTNKAWRYVGMDIVSGPNVDVVVEDPYNWKELDAFDVIVSGSVLEHVTRPWLFFEQLYAHLQPNGLLCLVTHAAGPEHKYPVDCYRFLPDGLRALAVFVKLDVLECYANWEQKKQYSNEPWIDSVLVARRVV